MKVAILAFDGVGALYLVTANGSMAHLQPLPGTGRAGARV